MAKGKIVIHNSWLNSDRRIGLVVFAIALAARLLFLAVRGPNVTPDSRNYLLLAHNLVSYGVYSMDKVPPLAPSVWFPPLYPAFLAVADWIGASVISVAIVQAIIGATSAVLVLVLARTAASANWAALVAFVYAVHPGNISSASSILSETLFTFLLLAGVCVLVVALARNRLLLTAVAGILLALAILCRSVVQLLPFALVAVTFIVPRMVFRLRHGLVLIFCLVTVISPWSVRSSRVAGRLIPVQDSGSVAVLFYVATRIDWDQADETTLWPRLVTEVERLHAVERERGEIEARDLPTSRLLFREGWKNVRSNPMGYLTGRLRAFPYFFLTSYDSFSGINKSLGIPIARRDALRLATKLCLLVVFSLIPFVLAVIGVTQSRKNLAAALAATVWLYMLVVYFPLWTEPRYWLPAVPFLLVSAAVGARLITGRFRAKLGF